ncbi:hypothetical protein SAY86_004558 [Trapa natans]|uniref:RING-type E3 ubiquitin transferase n=1 Tax=Trapa natans TaxID=22666 RepID=A0AAN7N4R4_TRANT|nr:hypothetical protein SAY86_004558 [Trapa natans]
MGFGYRRLLDEELSPAPSINGTMSTQPINNTLTEICEPFCDPGINDSGYCISFCSSLCPKNCIYSIPPSDYPVISDYYPPPPPPQSIFIKHHVSPLLLTTFVSLSLAVLVVLGYIIYTRLYGRRGNSRRGGGMGSLGIAQPQRALPPRDDELLDDLGPVLDHPIWYIRTVGLQPSVISKITVFKYKRGKGLVEGTDCSVCLTEFEEDETLRLLPKCSHAFHVSCIDTWLQSHTNCPNCRAPIVTDTTPSPSSEPNNNGSWEEIQLDNGGSDVDLGREIESNPRNRGETEEEQSPNRLDVVVDESNNELQPIRRSVSVDAFSAAKISLAVADSLTAKSSRKSDAELGDEENQDQRNKGSVGSSNPSIGRSVQYLAASSSSINRSLSWSGRFLPSMYSRNRSSTVLPL